MRSDDHSNRQRAARAQDLTDAQTPSSRSGAVTSRGTKYWKSGAIPLIAPEILGDIISEVADVALVISEEGTILSVLVNPMSDGFGMLENMEGKDIRSCLTIESVPKFEMRLEQFLESGQRPRALELNHAEGAKALEFPIRYTFHNVGPDGAVLMLGRDLRAVAEMQQQLVKAQIALERDYEVQREFDTRFRVLMENTREAIFFVSAQSGRITEVNPAAAALAGQGRDALSGRTLSEVIDHRGGGDLVEALITHAMTDRTSPIRCRIRQSGQDANLSPTVFRAAGERVMLCRVDLIEEGHTSASDTLTENLVGLFEDAPDAFVFAQENGTILSANDGFLDLIDAAHDASLKGLSLADYLQRGSVDLKVMTENATRSGRMRLYATKLLGEYGTPRPVEVSVTALKAGKSSIFAFLMRDASRVDAVRPASAPMSDDNLRSVMELVGSATLKEIVAETTNVVEKMCIETAVELTMNNRVAAAEMLGLSRQSLYVKLRKYGLLARDDD